jgi:hypothetical protein
MHAGYHDKIQHWEVSKPWSKIYFMHFAYRPDFRKLYKKFYGTGRCHISELAGR